MLERARETRKEYNREHKTEEEHEEQRCREVRDQKIRAHPDLLCIYQKEQDVGQVWHLEKYDPDLDCEVCGDDEAKEAKNAKEAGISRPSKHLILGAYWMANEKYKIGCCPKHFKEFIDNEHFYSKVIALPAGHDVDVCECTVYPGDKGYLG